MGKIAALLVGLVLGAAGSAWASSLVNIRPGPQSMNFVGLSFCCYYPNDTGSFVGIARDPGPSLFCREPVKDYQKAIQITRYHITVGHDFGADYRTKRTP